MNVEIMKALGFRKQIKAIAQTKCPFCGKKIDIKTEFCDEISRREYKISGLCQHCQDETFRNLNEE